MSLLLIAENKNQFPKQSQTVACASLVIGLFSFICSYQVGRDFSKLLDMEKCKQKVEWCVRGTFESRNYFIFSIFHLVLNNNLYYSTQIYIKIYATDNQ